MVTEASSCQGDGRNLLQTGSAQEAARRTERSISNGFAEALAGPLAAASAATGALDPSQGISFGHQRARSCDAAARAPGPLVVVTVLTLCFLACGAPLTVQYLAFALIAFLLSDRVLTTPESQFGPDGTLELIPGLPRLLLEWAFIFTVMMLIAGALQLLQLFPRLAWTSWFVATPAALIVSNACSDRVARWWTTRHSTGGRHIIIGATDIGLELAKRVSLNSAEGSFMGFFDFRDRGRLPSLAPEQWAGSCAGVADFVRRHGVDAIYIALPISTAPRISNLLRDLRDTTASIYFVPNLFAFDLVQPHCLEIHGIPALALCDTPLRGMPGLRKRAMDLIFGALMFALTAPTDDRHRDRGQA